MRKGGNSAGTSDVVRVYGRLGTMDCISFQFFVIHVQYYFSPSGKRYRSRTEVGWIDRCCWLEVSSLPVDIDWSSLLWVQIARDYGMEVKKAKRSGGGGGSDKKEADHTPLSREQSKEAAVQFAAEHTAPLKLLRDVKVVQFGSPSKEFSTEENLVLLNYRSRWTDALSKVVFESRVELSENSLGEVQRPSYNVYAIDTGDNGKKLRYPVGKGTSPDDVWSKVAERQKHVLLREKKTHDDLGQPSAGTVSPSPSSPTGTKISPVDQILKKASPLANVWGLEKFGFIDLTCLKAMEGQQGVEDTIYRYVNERKGWVEEQVKLRNLLSKRGQKLRLKPRVNSGAQHAAGDKAVERIVESLVKKVSAWNDKVEAKLAKQKEREQKKELKQKEHEKRRKEKVLLRQQAKQSLVEDMELEGATLAPPTPLPMTRLVEDVKNCTQIDLQRILEVWSLAHRFHNTLDMNMKDFPSVERMLEIYFQDPTAAESNETICAIFKAMIDFLVGEICEESMKIILEGDHDLRRVDFVPPTRNARMVTVSSNNWQDVLHRYLYTVAISAGISEKESIHYINYPLDNVHPYHIIDSITSGPTLLELENGDLNLLMSDEAEQRIAARRDAIGLRRSMEMSNQSLVDRDTVLKNDRAIRMVLARLFSSSAQAGGSMWDVCFLGPESCLEARLGYPMDMSHVLSRVECLVYQMEESCFNSFASDVFYACKILQTACQNGSSKVGTEKAIAQKVTVLNAMLRTLKSLYDTHSNEGIDGLLKHLEGEDIECVDSVDPRNLSPPQGACFICWARESNDVFETCCGCNMVAHVDCLEREWRLGSLDRGDCQEKKCLLCCSSAIPHVKYSILPGKYGSVWKLVRSLHDDDFNTWKPSDKVELVHLVSLLVAESPGVRDSLDQEEEHAKSVRTRLLSARNELKTLQQELKKHDENKELVAHRSTREAEIKSEKLIMKISKLEQDSKTFCPPRLIPLGYDRNWNKYWSLPYEALEQQEPFVLVEQGYGSLGDVDTPPNLAFYRGTEQMNSLLGYLNPKGQREKYLKDKLTSLNINSSAQEVAKSMEIEGGEQITGALGIEKLKDALLDYVDSLPDASYHEIRGTNDSKDGWKAFVGTIKNAEEAVASIVQLERMLDPSSYKVHWRLWAIPLPDPRTVKTLGAAWMRLETLKKAVKNSSNQNYLLCMLENEDQVDQEPSGGKFDDDATLADQEIALQLDAELNQRRVGTRSRRNWQILSPRDRSKRADRNLRDVTTKYYGEDDQEDDQEDEEPEESKDEEVYSSEDDDSSPDSSTSE